jgi:hypothetical protein
MLTRQVIVVTVIVVTISGKVCQQAVERRVTCRTAGAMLRVRTDQLDCFNHFNCFSRFQAGAWHLPLAAGKHLASFAEDAVLAVIENTLAYLRDNWRRVFS